MLELEQHRDLRDTNSGSMDSSSCYRKKFVDLGVRFLIGVTRVLVRESVESM